MTSHAENMPDQYLERLAELRLKIDALPESQRPHLYELADTIRQQFNQQRQIRKRRDGQIRDASR